MSKIKILLDCGHGSNTAGKRTAPFTKDVDIDGDGKIDVKKGEQYREHFANVMVGAFLEEELKRCKAFKIFKSGWNDEDASDDADTSLSSRQKIAKDNNIDYTVSIHFNAYGDGKTFNSAQGVGIYIHNTYPNDSKRFAEKVLSHLVKGTKQTNRGITAQGLAMCNTKTMGTKASILVELAFMTNKREAQELMANEKYCKECAVEIAKGICEYLGVAYVPYVEPKIEDDVFYRVQVGAFSVKGNADRLAKELNKLGYPTVIVEVKK